MRKFMSIAILAVFSLVLSPVLIGSSIPQACIRIPLKGLDGKTHTLEEFKGKKTILIIWRSTCPHCRTELPRIKELKEELGNDVNIVAVSLDTNDQYFENYIEELKPNFEILRSLELRPCIGGIRGVPTIFVLDEELNIIEKFEGTTPNDKIKAALNLK